MNGRGPQLSPLRLLAGLVLPFAGYLIVREVVGSATVALIITTGVPAIWLVLLGVARRRLDPIAILVIVTALLALGAYALTGGSPIALKLRRGAVTGPMGIALLISVAWGRPLLLILAERAAKLNPDQHELQARLADPVRRRVLAILTAIIGAVFTLDGASQIALALIVPTGSFVADSTAARILVLGTGLVITVTYLRHQRQRLRPVAPS